MIKKIFCLTLCLKSARYCYRHVQEEWFCMPEMLEESGRVRTIVRDDGMVLVEVRAT